jgi:glutathione S-transferase
VPVARVQHRQGFHKKYSRILPPRSFYSNEEWAKLRRPGAVEFVQKRLSALSKSLGDKPHLEGDRFTAGDLMMTIVLRILKHTDIITSDKRLAAYVERCTSRPAFKRAFDAQIGDFRKAA